jgi:hypothetical protein
MVPSVVDALMHPRQFNPDSIHSCVLHPASRLLQLCAVRSWRYLQHCTQLCWTHGSSSISRRRGRMPSSGLSHLSCLCTCHVMHTQQPGCSRLCRYGRPRYVAWAESRACWHVMALFLSAPWAHFHCALPQPDACRDSAVSSVI